MRPDSARGPAIRCRGTRRALHAARFGVAMGWLALEYLAAECWFGPSLAILQDVLPPAARGSASGLFTALTLFGNAAPYAIGRVVGRGGGAPSLRDALGVAVPAFYAASAVGFIATSVATARWARRDKRR